MANLPIIRAIEIAELILQVDATRDPGSPFKLSTDLSGLVTDRLTVARSANSAVFMIEGATVGASVQRQQALARMAELLRFGYRGIAAVSDDAFTDALRAQTFAAYGWQGGKIGELESPTRIEELAMLAPVATSDPTVPTLGKYPASLVTRIGNWLATFQAATLIANGGDRQTLIATRNEARDGLETINSRVRYWYCAASDATDATPELARIGMQPRRAPGEAEPEPLPGVPGAVSFDAATRELSVPGKPAHATILRAYRQPMGGEAVSAGVSASNVVSVVGSSPLMPGVTYTLWLVAENSRGMGPESEKVTFTA